MVRSNFEVTLAVYVGTVWPIASASPASTSGVSTVGVSAVASKNWVDSGELATIREHSIPACTTLFCCG